MIKHDSENLLKAPILTYSRQQLMDLRRQCCFPSSKAITLLKQCGVFKFRGRRGGGCDDINNSALIKEPSSHLDILVYQYGNVLHSLLDRHAPIKQHVVTVCPSAPWYSTEIAQNKRIRRKLETTSK